MKKIVASAKQKAEKARAVRRYNDSQMPPKIAGTVRKLHAKVPPRAARKTAAPEGMKVTDETVAMFGSQPVVRRRIVPYQAAPGVVPPKSQLALDSKNSAYAHLPAYDAVPNTGQNFYGWLNQQMIGLGFPGYAYLSELSQRSEYRAPAATISDEMTRKFIRFISKSKDPKAADKIKQLEAAFKRHNVRQVIRTAIQTDLFFGRSQIYIDIDGSDDPAVKAQPLTIDKKTIKKGSLRGFKVIEPIWTTPLSYNSTDATAADFYRPIAWFVLGMRVHYTRLITFVSQPVPDILKPAYNFGGVSLTQLSEPYVQRWLQTVNGVNRLINNFSIIALRTNLMTILAGRSVDTKGVMNRAKLFTSTRDNQGMMLLDKDSEELDQIAVPLGGLHELQAQAQEHMAAPSHVPLVKLTGITPSGLNASSEGEITVFHEYIGAGQENHVEPGLDVIFDVIQLDEFGEIDEDIDYEFVELVETTRKEVADTRKANTELIGTLIDKNVIDNDEGREALRRDPDSGFSWLEGDAPEAPTDPNVINPATGEPYAPPGGDPEDGPPASGDKD